MRWEKVYRITVFKGMGYENDMVWRGKTDRERKSVTEEKHLYWQEMGNE